MSKYSLSALALLSGFVFTAAFSAVPASAQEISGKFTGGSVQVGNDTGTCDSNRYGSIRFNTNKFQGCSTGGWVDIGTFGATAGITALTGEVTASGTGSVAATIANSAVTNAKIANATIIATDKLTATGTKNNTTFLRGDNTWATIPDGADNLGNHTATQALNMASNLLSGLAQMTGSEWNANYDVWLQGGTATGSGDARNLALLGVKSSDALHVNYNGEYTGGTIIGGVITGNGSGLTALNATNLASGTVPAARLPAFTGDVTKAAGGTALTIASGAVDLAHLSATGTKNNTTFLRGDNTWAAPPSGGAAPAGTWCGRRWMNRNGSTISYPNPTDGGESFPCNGTNLTGTYASGTFTINCPSGYVGRILSSTSNPIGGTTLYEAICRKS